MTHLTKRVRNRIWGVYNWLMVILFFFLVGSCVRGFAGSAMVITALLSGLLSRYFYLKRKLNPDVRYTNV